MIKKLKKELCMKEKNFEEFESLFLETITQVQKALDAHYFNPKRLNFPLELPACRIGFIEKDGSELFIEFTQDKRFTVVRILCCEGFSSEEPEFSEFDIDKHYLDHKAVDFETGKRYIGRLGYARRYFCLSCISDDLKIKYEEQLGKYKQLRGQVREAETNLESVQKACEIKRKLEAE